MALLWQRGVQGLFALSQPATIAMCTVLFLAIAVLDIVTPPQLNLTFLYVFVILLACWNAGAVWGLVFAGLAFVVQIFAFPESAIAGVSSFHRGIILGNRFFTFLIVVVLTVPLRRLYEREKRTARIDFLTEVPNRKAFHELLVVEIARNLRTGNAFAVAFIDCDNFKSVNDQFGHHEGDDLLRGVAATNRRTLRATDTVARIGGDEFAVLLPDTELDAAMEIMERLRGALSQRMTQDQWPVTFSIGLGIFNRAGLAPDEILKACDTLMYDVKEKGKDSIAWQMFVGSDDALVAEADAK